MHIPRSRDVYPITCIKLLCKYLASNSLSRRKILQFPAIKHVRLFLYFCQCLKRCFRWTSEKVSTMCITSKNRRTRSEEHTSELQSQSNLVCRLLLEKKKNGIMGLYCG